MKFDLKDAVIAALAALQVVLFVVVPKIREWWRKS